VASLLLAVAAARRDTSYALPLAVGCLMLNATLIGLSWVKGAQQVPLVFAIYQRHVRTKSRSDGKQMKSKLVSGRDMPAHVWQRNGFVPGLATSCAPHTAQRPVAFPHEV
jgi:hypothetical protein